MELHELRRIFSWKGRPASQRQRDDMIYLAHIRATLGEIGHRLGRKALEEVAAAAKPETILGWYRG